VLLNNHTTETKLETFDVTTAFRGLHRKKLVLSGTQMNLFVEIMLRSVP